MIQLTSKKIIQMTLTMSLLMLIAGCSQNTSNEPETTDDSTRTQVNIGDLKIVKFAPNSGESGIKVSTTTRIFAQFDKPISDCSGVTKSPFKVELKDGNDFIPQEDLKWRPICKDNFIVAVPKQRLKAASTYRAILNGKSITFSTLPSDEEASDDLPARLEMIRVIAGPAGVKEDDPNVFSNKKIDRWPLGNVAVYDARNIMISWLALDSWDIATEADPGNLPEIWPRFKVVVGHYDSVDDKLSIAYGVNDEGSDANHTITHPTPWVFFDRMGYGYVSYFADYVWEYYPLPDPVARKKFMQKMPSKELVDAYTVNGVQNIKDGTFYLTIRDHPRPRLAKLHRSSQVGQPGPRMKKSKVPFPKTKADWGEGNEVFGRCSGTCVGDPTPNVEGADGNTYIACTAKSGWIDAIKPCKGDKICWVGDGARQVIERGFATSGGGATTKVHLFADRFPYGQQKLYMTWMGNGNDQKTLGIIGRDVNYLADLFHPMMAYSDDYGKSWKSPNFIEKDGKIISGKRTWLSPTLPDDNNRIYYKNDAKECDKITVGECTGPIAKTDPAFRITTTRIGYQFNSMFVTDDGTIYFAFNRSQFLDRGWCIEKATCNSVTEKNCVTGNTTDTNAGDMRAIKCSKAVMNADGSGETFVPDQSKSFDALMIVKFRLGEIDKAEEIAVVPPVTPDDTAFIGPPAAIYVKNDPSNGDDIYVWYFYYTNLEQQLAVESTSYDGGKTWAHNTKINDAKTLKEKYGIETDPYTPDKISILDMTRCFEGTYNQNGITTTVGMAYDLWYKAWFGTPANIKQDVDVYDCKTRAQHGVHYYQRSFTE